MRAASETSDVSAEGGDVEVTADASPSLLTVAVGVAGVFMETHPDPAHALSDGPNAWPLDLMESLLVTLKALDALVKTQGFAEAQLTR